MLRPTVTQRVRAFLAAEGVRLEPWASLDETYARLYALLAARRDDPSFWAPLGSLLGEVAADAADAGGPAGLAPPLAELLSGVEIDRLVAELRRSLPARGKRGGLAPIADFTAALRAPALCGFLLLGLAAAACAGGEESVSLSPLLENTGAAAAAAVQNASPEAIAPPEPQARPEIAPPPEPAGPWFDGCTLAQKGVLWRSIDRSSLADGDKRALCDCFAALDGRWTNRLSYLFRNGKPAEIAKALEEMVTCCAADERAADATCADVAKLHSGVQQRTENAVSFGTLYKGVCFD